MDPGASSILKKQPKLPDIIMSPVGLDQINPDLWNCFGTGNAQATIYA